VQAIKAGILEAADVLVVNKADLPGADNAVRALQSSLELASGVRRVWDHHGRLEAVDAPDDGVTWLPPVLKTVAALGEGIHEVVDALLNHRSYLETTGGRARRDRERLSQEVHALLGDRLLAQFLDSHASADLGAALEQVFARQSSPRQAVERLLALGG